jgi:hypothetical protein
MPLARQFVVTSLVCNSGILFAPERIDQILALRTAAHLVEVNEKNRHQRPLLPVLPPADALARLAAGASYPRQLTSWGAVYHVLQRYGAWVGVARFARVFGEDGAFLARATP